LIAALTEAFVTPAVFTARRVFLTRS